MSVRSEQLGNVCQVLMGQSPPSSTYNTCGNGLPFFQGKADFGDINPTVHTFCSGPLRIAETGDVLISVRAPVGPTNVARERCCIGRGLAALRGGRKLDTTYLLYFLRHEEPRIAAIGTGSTFEAVGRSDLEKTRIPLPSLPEQRHIAEMLGQADRLRHTRRYALELSDSFLPAAFLEMFGDPVENPHGFPRSDVGELLPADREGVKCGPFGSALKNHEYTPSGVPVWSMNNVAPNEFTEEGCMFITEEKFQDLKAYATRNGDILISRAGTVGRMAIVETKHARSIIHTNIIRLSLNHERVLPIYFVVLMTWFAARVARLKRGKEDAYTFMGTGTLAELSIPVPPLALQQRFADLVREHERLRATQRESLRQAEHLFQSLLNQVFGDRP